MSFGISRPRTSDRRSKSSAEPLAADECYGCTLCHRTTLHLSSIRRHLFSIHKITDTDSMETFYETRRLPVPKLGPASTEVASTSRAEDPTDPAPKPAKRARTKRVKTNNVGCQVPCMDCQRWEARAEELEKALEEMFQSAEKVKAVLEKA